jgi:hypothetical protein
MQDAEGVYVIVGSGLCSEHIDAILVSCGGISGKVTDLTGQTISGVLVEIYNATLSANGVIASALTGSDGTYTVIGLPVHSDNKVKFVADSLGYSNEWYADLVSVTASATTEHIDAVLEVKTTGSALPAILQLLLL